MGYKNVLMMRKIENIIISPLTAAIIVYANTGEMEDKYRERYKKAFNRELPLKEKIKKLHPISGMIK